MKIGGFKGMSEYLKVHAGLDIHPDTLRKATKDTRNPLPVEWDAGFAKIDALALMRWRESRRGQQRSNRKQNALAA